MMLDEKVCFLSFQFPKRLFRSPYSYSYYCKDEPGCSFAKGAWLLQEVKWTTYSAAHLIILFVFAVCLLKKICGLCRQLFLFLKIAACVASPRREEDSIDMVYSKWIMPKMAPLFPKCLWPCHHSIPLQAQTLFLQKHHRRAWEGGCWNTLEQVKFLMCLCPTWTLSEYFETRWNTLAFVPHEHLVNICRCFSSR